MWLHRLSLGALFATVATCSKQIGQTGEADAVTKLQQVIPTYQHSDLRPDTVTGIGPHKERSSARSNEGGQLVASRVPAANQMGLVERERRLMTGAAGRPRRVRGSLVYRRNH